MNIYHREITKMILQIWQKIRLHLTLKRFLLLEQWLQTDRSSEKQVSTCRQVCRSISKYHYRQLCQICVTVICQIYEVVPQQSKQQQEQLIYEQREYPKGLPAICLIDTRINRASIGEPKCFSKTNNGADIKRCRNQCVAIDVVDCT